MTVFIPRLCKAGVFFIGADVGSPHNKKNTCTAGVGNSGQLFKSILQMFDEFVDDKDFRNNGAVHDPGAA